MPTRRKRAQDWDPNKSDPEDETYGTSVSKPSRSHQSKKKTSRHTSKKRRKRYSDGDDDEDEDEDSIEDESDLSIAASDQESEEAEEVELGPSGRPKRKAAPRKHIVEESGSEDPIEEDEEDQEEAANGETRNQESEDLNAEPELQTPKKTSGGKSIRLILKGTPGVFPPKLSPSRGTRRSTRARSSSVAASRPTSSHKPPSRRSSRIAHDEAEAIIALSNSGHHVETIRQGTSSPPPANKRLSTGGKGLKKPSTSVVYEESQESSSRSKAQGEDENAAQDQPEATRSQEDDGQNEMDIAEQIANAAERESQEADADAGGAIVPESGEENLHEEDDEEDPVSRPRRMLRQRDSKKGASDVEEGAGAGDGKRLSTRQNARSALGKRKARSSQRAAQESSDFEPGPDEGGDEDVSDSEVSLGSPGKRGRQGGEEESPIRANKRRKPNPRSRRQSDERDSEVDADEVAEELDELTANTSRRRRTQTDILYEPRHKTRRQTQRPDYRIVNPELAFNIEEDDGPPVETTPSKRARGAGISSYQRSLFSTYGPFGGAGGPPPVLGGSNGLAAAAGADSDSSDDEGMPYPKPQGVGGFLGMTPTAANPPSLGLYSAPAPAGQVHGADPLQTPANVGKVKDKQALADADPLGVDQNVNFDGVGGLAGHIDQLKEMVALPLLYPEVFQRFHVTPPRGVLFHGPPGTGKTLLARALASSVSSQGKKVTFYMRKGADALSKWVGEAEKQLRLLFEEARKNQPSIIFFDEIDGLAPVRSSKQEQIHASIVSTLLALMDGMDGRGQVIVIGATNRPDSVDPALRRPGRFDREFYFPLPNLEARRAILDIHTKGWNPPLASAFKDDIAHATKGYGGADLRALCTEAALNAVQRHYPQIYKSNEKLQIKPETINVTAKDFMISIKKMVPSSERSATSGASPLPKQIEPLLREQLRKIENRVEEVMPQKKRLTALQEAEFEDVEDDRGMMMERMQQEFERSRIFRPRLLIKGSPGMGQQYLASALLNHFEGLHVQAFDLPTIMSDSTRSPEAAIVQLFTEVKRHKPSVIYIPNVDVWYETVQQSAISTFVGLLRTLSSTDPVLLLGVLECKPTGFNEQMIKDLFGFSKRSHVEIGRPNEAARQEYFDPILQYLNTAPADFPEPTNRKKRDLPRLLPAPAEPSKPSVDPMKEEKKVQKKRDRIYLNQLKIRIQPIMDYIKLKYKKFRMGVVDESQISYLYDEEDPSIVTSDLPPEQQRLSVPRPFEKAKDRRGEMYLKETATGKCYYNMEIVTIEKRLSNGYYKRPKDFLRDIKKLTKDARTTGDIDRLIKANELQANVEVDMAVIETENPWLNNELENVYQRELQREKELADKVRQEAAGETRLIENGPSNVPPGDARASSSDHTGPIILGQPVPQTNLRPPVTPSNPSNPSQQHSLLTNGISDLSDLQPRLQSNGTSVPSRGEGDVHMTNSDDPPSTTRETQGSSFGPSAQTRPMDSYTGAPTSLQHRRSIPGSLSQVSAVTPLAPGANPDDYVNYASTTSSDKKNTGSSGDKINTQSTEGQDGILGQSLAKYPSPLEANSDIPPTVGNTQESQFPNTANSNPSDLASSQGNRQHGSPPEQSSQNPAVPPFPKDYSRTNINSLLNDDPTPSRALVPTHQQVALTLDKLRGAELVQNMVGQTSGCSLEQLEQVYSALMSEIWRTRGELDRRLVIRQVSRRFVEVMTDIHTMQDVEEWSMTSQA